MKLRHLTAMLLLALLAPLAIATSMVPINLAQTVELAETGFVGTVSDARVVETPAGWGEQIRVKVSEAVYGDVAAGQTIEWIQPRLSQAGRIPGMPEFRKGEEHLVFLAGKAAGSDFQAPLGLGQGSFRVHTVTATGQKLARNGFGNRTLFAGLDTARIGAAVEAREKAEAAARADNQSTDTQQATQSLKLAGGVGGAIDLGSLVRVGKALKADPKPTETFRADRDATTSGTSARVAE